MPGIEPVIGHYSFCLSNKPIEPGILVGILFCYVSYSWGATRNPSPSHSPAVKDWDTNFLPFSFLTVKSTVLKSITSMHIVGLCCNDTANTAFKVRITPFQQDDGAYLQDTCHICHSWQKHIWCESRPIQQEPAKLELIMGRLNAPTSLLDSLAISASGYYSHKG